MVAEVESEVLREVAAECVGLVAQQFGVSLDWSLDSLTALDAVCSDLLPGTYRIAMKSTPRVPGVTTRAEQGPQNRMLGRHRLVLPAAKAARQRRRTLDVAGEHRDGPDGKFSHAPINSPHRPVA